MQDAVTPNVNHRTPSPLAPPSPPPHPSPSPPITLSTHHPPHPSPSPPSLPSRAHRSAYVHVPPSRPSSPPSPKSPPPSPSPHPASGCREISRALPILGFHHPSPSPPPDPIFIPLQDDAKYSRGNVRSLSKGGHVPIEADAADRIHVGRRHQRNGLLYDASFPGFHPASEPHVFPAPASGRGCYRVLLESELVSPRDAEYAWGHEGKMEGGDATGELAWGGIRATADWEGWEQTVALREKGWKGHGRGVILDIEHDPEVDPRLLSFAELCMMETNLCREGEGSVGGMVGVGEHLRRDGLRGSFVVSSEGARRSIATGMEVGGRDFARHFGGKGVGWEEVQQEQRRLWPAGAPSRPAHWDASLDLGNSMHRDHDGSPCFARWIAREGHAGRSCGWWLGFPRHGVWVELAHGVRVRWHGRLLSHATHVPEVADGDGLYSIFTALPADLMGVLGRARAGEVAMRERHAPAPVGREPGFGRRLFDSLSIGQHITYRFTPEAPPDVASSGIRKRRKWGAEHARWVRATVAKKGVDYVVVKDVGGGLECRLALPDVVNRVRI